MDLFWHRRDLRVADNVGLAAATRSETTPAGNSDQQHDAQAAPSVAPIFIFDDAVLEHGSDVRVRRLLDGLATLREAYRDRGSDLLVAHGDPATVLPVLATQLGATRVVWNRDYSGLARERDTRVRRALADVDVHREAHHDTVLHEPGSIRTNAGEPYSVYSYYWKKWRDRPVDDPAPAPDAADLASAAKLADAIAEQSGSTNEPALDVSIGDLPVPTDLGCSDPDVELGPAGTEAARARLDAFLDADVFTYETDRDYPARDGTSRLSVFLKYGEIGIREVDAAVRDAMASAAAGEIPTGAVPAGTGGGESGADDADPESSVEEFRAQLAWRDFYLQVLYHNPAIVTENYKTFEYPIDWRDDPDEIAAWKRGETGYPIVDAGMRQLHAEGHMHNRVRMIVASFLTKDLLADWRHGYEHFKAHLADHDTANDNGGWQWAASTGTDAQPYFRIFNPMTQGERYDSDAAYITTYVPELRDVDPALIHEWPELLAVQRANAAPDYPDPIVDHGDRRERALAMYKRARGEEPDE